MKLSYQKDSKVGDYGCMLLNCRGFRTIDRQCFCLQPSQIYCNVVSEGQSGSERDAGIVLTLCKDWQERTLHSM